MPKELTHAGKGWAAKIIAADEITQAQTHQYTTAVMGYEHAVDLNDRVVKAAVKVGWVIEPAGLDVDQASPGFVSWIAGKIAEAVREAIEVPPE